MIEWTKEEWAALKRANGGRASDEAVNDISRCAMELAAARGGTMTAGEIASMRRDNEHVPLPWSRQTIRRLLDSLAAQGATVVTLQGKVAELEREGADARAERDAAREDLQAARAEVERLKAEIGAIHTAVFTGVDEPLATDEGQRIVSEVSLLKRRAAPQEARTHDIYSCHVENCPSCERVISTQCSAKNERRGFLVLTDSGVTPVGQRHPCSDGRCQTHPCNDCGDAQQECGPGCMEHVVNCSNPTRLPYGSADAPTRKDDAVVRTLQPCSPTYMHDDAATPGHPERAKGRNEAEWNNITDNERTCWNDGAEAMRAACWESIQPLLNEIGLGPLEKERWKKAIEGAVP